MSIGAVAAALLGTADNGSLAQVTNDPQQRSIGNWTYHVVRKPIEDIEFAQIYTQARSVSVRDESAFAIRCQSNQVYAILFTNHFFRSTDSIRLRYKVDGKRATTERWQFVRSEAILMSPHGDYVSRLITSLRKGKTLTIRVSNDDGVLMSSRYPVNGFDEAIAPISQRCPF